MDNTNEYMIIRTAGYIQVHGLSYVYINKGEGVESESARFLTDEIAKSLLKENPDRSAVIVRNPDFNPDAKVKVADAKTKADSAKANASAKGKGKKTAATEDAPKVDVVEDNTEPAVTNEVSAIPNGTADVVVNTEPTVTNEGPEVPTDPAKTEGSESTTINS